MLARLGAGVVVALAMGAAPPLAAHDLWIEPTRFAAEPGQVVGVRLRVGVDLAGDALPRSAALIDQFIVEDASGRKPLIGREGADPAGALRVLAPGLHVIGYHSRPSRLELPAQKFNAYLAEEGLAAIIAKRASRGETSADSRELFYRCAKSLVWVGPPSEAQNDRVLGLPLELVAERNPSALRNGEALPVQLIYEGRPLAGALVVAINRADPSAKLAARSDHDGRVHLPVRAGGMWLVKAVHMVEAGAGSDAEWASYWASLTFE